MTRCSLAALAVLLVSTATALAQPRLIGITGNQGDSVPNPANERLYEINLTDFSLTPLVSLPWVPDTDSIAFNPDNGLLYRLSGAELQQQPVEQRLSRQPVHADDRDQLAGIGAGRDL